MSYFDKVLMTGLVFIGLSILTLYKFKRRLLAFIFVFLGNIVLALYANYYGVIYENGVIWLLPFAVACFLGWKSSKTPTESVLSGFLKIFFLIMLPTLFVNMILGNYDSLYRRTRLESVSGLRLPIKSQLDKEEAKAFNADMIRILKKGDRYARRDAVFFLNRYGMTDEAIPWIEAALEDESASVREMARMALQHRNRSGL